MEEIEVEDVIEGILTKEDVDFIDYTRDKEKLEDIEEEGGGDQ